MAGYPGNPSKYPSSPGKYPSTPAKYPSAVNSYPSGSDTVPPTLMTAAVNAGGNTLTLTYSEALDTGSVPALGDFSLTGTAISALTGTPGVSGSAVTLTITPKVGSDETGIKINYTPGVNKIRDVAGNNAASLTNQAVTNGSTYVQTPADIMGTNLKAWLRSDLGVTTATGVSAWADQSGNGNNAAQGTGSLQPVYNATDATLSNRPSMTFDGVDDFLSNTTMSLGALPLTFVLVAKQETWTSADVFFACDSTSAVLCVRQAVASPQFTMLNTTSANTSTRPLASWARIQAEFTNSTSDRLLVGATAQTGANAGSNTGTGFRLAKQGGAGTAFGNITLAEFAIFNVTPSATQNSRLNVYFTSLYGSGVVS